MDIVAVIHLLKGFDHWNEGFQSHTGVRSNICDESRTTIMRDSADPDTVSVFLYDVQPEAMDAMMSDPAFQQLSMDLGEEQHTKRIYQLSEPDA